MERGSGEISRPFKTILDILRPYYRFKYTNVCSKSQPGEVSDQGIHITHSPICTRSVMHRPSQPAFHSPATHSHPRPISRQPTRSVSQSFTHPTTYPTTPPPTHCLTGLTMVHVCFIRLMMRGIITSSTVCWPVCRRKKRTSWT